MKKSIAILLVFIFLFSLCACKKEEPLPSEEIKEETFVKEFSDGRLYTEGDIYSFCETENYYFTLDKAEDGIYLSVFSKDGDLLKRVKPSIYNANREVILFPKTDIYPLGNDRIVFGSAFGLYSQYICRCKT